MRPPVPRHTANGLCMLLSRPSLPVSVCECVVDSPYPRLVCECEPEWCVSAVSGVRSGPVSVADWALASKQASNYPPGLRLYSYDWALVASAYGCCGALSARLLTLNGKRWTGPRRIKPSRIKKAVANMSYIRRLRRVRLLPRSDFSDLWYCNNHEWWA